MEKKRTVCLFMGFMFLSLALSGPVCARVKLTALPERARAVIRLDNPRGTVVLEERTLSLRKGINRVDFSWEGVSLDADSIRLVVLSHPYKAVLLGVSYPPREAALVWEVHCEDAYEVTVRITYLLSSLDRIAEYRGTADKEETHMNLKGFHVIRNFSGEDFKDALLLFEEGQSHEGSIVNGETRRLSFSDKNAVPFDKVWTFDAARLPWDPENSDNNVGIPVSYRIRNAKEAGLGRTALPKGKVRMFQEDGKGGLIFLGEDRTPTVSVGEEMEVYIGDSRDIVVTQRKQKDEKINVRRNRRNRVVLYDTDEVVTATIENFKDRPAKLKMIQHIPGQWDMEACNMKYERKDAFTLDFIIQLPARGKKELMMHYHRRNLR